jgi:hypothetical protein
MVNNLMYGQGNICLSCTSGVSSAFFSPAKELRRDKGVSTLPSLPLGLGLWGCKCIISHDTCVSIYSNWGGIKVLNDSRVESAPTLEPWLKPHPPK